MRQNLLMIVSLAVATTLTVTACTSAETDAEPSDSTAPSSEASALTGSTAPTDATSQSEFSGVQLRPVVATESSSPDRTSLGDLAADFEELDCSGVEYEALDPDQPGVACDLTGQRYALDISEAPIGVKQAEPFRDESGELQINMTIDEEDVASLAALAGDPAGANEYAFVVDGVVATSRSRERLSGAVVVIPGVFDQATADELVERLSGQ